MTDRRKDRVRRLIAKRPPTLPQIIVSYAPNEQARDRLLELLLDLIEGRGGGR